MLKILFSPSEAKSTEHSDTQIKDIYLGLEPRIELIDAYKSVIDSYDIDKILNLFGIKKEQDVLPYMKDIYKSKTLRAIQRYSGVAYEYLDYETLSVSQKEFLLNRVIIFSNLFGPVKASDLIPNYKVKQGNKIAQMDPAKFYKDKFTEDIDQDLSNFDILDLRAGYYEKFYKVKSNYYSMKFLKNGKTVSHYAKAYRGKVLREIAINKIDSLSSIIHHTYDGLELLDVNKNKNKTELVYTILE